MLDHENAPPGVGSEAFKRLANETLFDNDLERRMRNFGMLLGKMRPEDAIMMHHEFVRMQKEGRPFGEDYALFASRWGEIDGKGVMKFYFDAGNPNPNDVRNALRGWAQKDPESAMDWLDSSEQGIVAVDQYGGRNAVLIGWARNNMSSATDWVVNRSHELSEKEQKKFLNPAIDLLLIQKLYSDGVGGASHWLATLPDGEEFDAASANAWHNMAHQRLNHLDPEQAAQTWQTVGNRSWAGVKEFSRFYDLIASGNGGSDQEFFNSLQRNGWTDSQVIEKFEKWAESDLEITAHWLVNQDPSAAVRHLAIQGLVNHLKETNPDAAAAWEQELHE